MGYSGFYTQILAVDIEGETWRKIPCPRHSKGSIHQAQGHLCVCTVAGSNDSKLSIWILEDYGTNNWTLKHTVTTQILFGRINIRFGFLDFIDECIVITQEWNLIFFARRMEQSSHMTWTAEEFVSSLPVSFGMVDVPLKRVQLQTILSSLCSLVLGFISRAVNKAAFDVYLCHAF